VKADKKTRENYIGHSLHTSSVPTFNDPKPNAMWYLKQSDAAADSATAELARLKQLEQDMMLEALGLKPKGSAAAAANRRPLLPHEMAAALKRTPSNDAGAAEDGPSAGLGAAIGSRSALGTFGVPETIEGVDLPPDHAMRMQQQAASLTRGSAVDSASAVDADQAAEAGESSRRKHKHKHSRRKHKESSKHRHKKRKQKSKSSRTSASSSSSSESPHRRHDSESDERDRRRRRHDSESDDRRQRRHDSDESDAGGRRRRRHDSESSRSRSRSRSPRR
jgi:hypothetical protein